MDITAVVPVYNEAASLPACIAELREVLKKLHKKYEIICVNDGSTDHSLQVLSSISGITILNLNRNYGQATALDAGFKAAQGELIISIDADGQNDPHDIPAMLRELEEKNLDVVAGWRFDRQDSRSIRVLTRVGRSLRALFIADSVHDSGCTLRVYRAEAAKSLDIGGEMHRYILALLRWKGFRIGEVRVNHRPRTAGKSNYTWTKSIRGFIDLIYIWFIHKYSQRPLHLFGYASIFSFVVGLFAAFWTLYDYLTLDIRFARDVWLVIACFFFLMSVLLFSFGIVIDLLIRLLFNTSPYEKRYYIRSIINT